MSGGGPMLLYPECAGCGSGVRVRDGRALTSGGSPTEPLPSGRLWVQTGVATEVRPGRPFLRVGVRCLKTFDLFDSYPI
jgi:hypothetical protein